MFVFTFILHCFQETQQPKRELIAENGHLIYYRPIKIAIAACHTCHGNTGKEIDMKITEIIKQKYPEDLATGYKEGDLRGLWKITFIGEQDF